MEDIPAHDGGLERGLPASALHDLLGFTLPQLTVQQAADRLASSRRSEAYSRNWAAYATRQELPSRSTLKGLIRKAGIHHKYRTWVWCELSGANELKASRPVGYFRTLLSVGETKSKSLHQIELDLPRTFPEHKWLHGSEGQAALRAVLVAYSMHDPKAGYCQGMNFVAGTMLLSTDRTPETAFWLMVALLERILYPHMYGPYLPGFQVEMKALSRLVSRKLPILHQHLEQLGCEMTILATDWFMCLFVTTLPHEVSLRVWDCLFCEGSKILYRMSLALLKLHQDLLLKHDNTGELLHSLKQSVCNFWSVDRLWDTGFSRIGGIRSLPMAKIEKYRQLYLPEVEEMVKERESNRRRQEERESAKTQRSSDSSVVGSQGKRASNGTNGTPTSPIRSHLSAGSNASPRQRLTHEVRLGA